MWAPLVVYYTKELEATAVLALLDYGVGQGSLGEAEKEPTASSALLTVPATHHKLQALPRLCRNNRHKHTQPALRPRLSPTSDLMKEVSATGRLCTKRWERLNSAKYLLCLR